MEGDSPYIIVVNSLHKKVEMGDDYEVFLMFKPYDNGVASYYVPLDAYEWKPNGSATRSGSSWSMDGGATLASPHTINPLHPEWTSKVENDPNWPPIVEE